MKRRRLVLGAVLALAVLAVVAVLALPGIVRWIVIRQVAAATGRPVTLERLELSLRQGRLALRGLRVIDRDGVPLATLERVDVRFSPRALLLGRGHVTDARLDTFSVNRPPMLSAHSRAPKNANRSAMLPSTPTAIDVITPMRSEANIAPPREPNPPTTTTTNTITPSSSAMFGFVV